MQPSLSIGTAQFGSPYGITNNEGIVRIKEVQKILNYAKNQNIKMLDTAPDYGNSEKVIGRILKKNEFKITSKFPLQKELIFSKKNLDHWDLTIKNTLDSLNVNQIENYLIHNIKDLSKEGSSFLVDWLISLKRDKLVKRIGVSIYSKDDLDNLSSELLEVIQLPLSIYDQRLKKDGTLNNLVQNGAAIQIRSVFLQGLIISSANKLPNWVGPEFIRHHINFESFVKNNNLHLIDMALAFTQSLENVESILIGICNLEQLKQIVLSLQNVSHLEFKNFDKWFFPYAEILDPRSWPN